MIAVEATFEAVPGSITGDLFYTLRVIVNGSEELVFSLSERQYHTLFSDGGIEHHDTTHARAREVFDAIATAIQRGGLIEDSTLVRQKTGVFDRQVPPDN